MSDAHGQNDDHHDEHGHDHHAPTSFWTKYVFSTDHKVIGLQFTFASLIFVIIGGLLALGVRYELAWPRQDVPHAEILPRGFTNDAPEANLGHWQVGGTVVFTQNWVKDGEDWRQPTPEEFDLSAIQARYNAKVEKQLKPLIDEAAKLYTQENTPAEAREANEKLEAMYEELVPPRLRMQAYGEPPRSVEAAKAAADDVDGETAPSFDRAAIIGAYHKYRNDKIHEYLLDTYGEQIGAEVAEIVDIPTGTEATLAGFPDGLIVNLSPGLYVQRGRRKITLKSPLAASVDPNDLMGDYYYKDNLARVNSGTKVRVAEVDPETGEVKITDEVVTILGTSRGTTTGTTETTEGQVVLPIDAAKTKVDINVALTTATYSDDESIRVPVEATTLKGLLATDVQYPKKALTPQSYNQLFTMHATIMIFFVIIPMLVGGFGNFLIPLMIGCRDMAFPKLNMMAFWIAIPAGFFIMLSFWTDGGPSGGGWTQYPTLSENIAPYGATNLGTTLWALGVGLVGFSSVVGSLNYITTIVNMRAPGMTFFRMPLTVWSLFITSILSVFATPMVTAAIILLAFDRLLGTVFFPAWRDVPVLIDGVWQTVRETTGGQPLMFQHLFWFYSHPAVYIMILPAMGIASDVLSVFARKPIFGYKPMVFAICAIAGLGFIVWGHHMFQSGMNPILGTTFMASTIMIAVPSAIKTFNWLGTLWGGNIKFTPAMLNALGFVSMFVIGGLSGIFMASAPVDVQIHDTYFIVAHIHYVLFGGSIFAIFAGIYHWWPKMFGRQLNQKWGVIHFVLNIIAFNCTFFTMHILGIGGHPRRYASIIEYPTLEHLQPLNVFMSISAICLGMAQIPFFYNAFASMPRKLARGMVVVFATILVGPTVIGLNYWNHAASAGADGYAAWQGNLGFLCMLAAVLALAVMLIRGLPTAGKVWSAVLLLPLAAYVASVYTTDFATLPDMSTEGRTMFHWEATVQLLQSTFWSPMTQDLIVAFGYGVLFATAVGVAVFALWELAVHRKLGFVAAFILPLLMMAGFVLIRLIGGIENPTAVPGWMLNVAGGYYALVVVSMLTHKLAGGKSMTCHDALKNTLYFVALPAFLWPAVVHKPDMFIWLGMPSLYEARYVIIALLALPGLGYLLAKRPSDEFGHEVGANPWHANSLEWATTSPPPHLNFDDIPVVHRGPYEYSSPVADEDYLEQTHQLPPGVVEPAAH